MPTRALILDCHLRALVSVSWSFSSQENKIIDGVAKMTVTLPFSLGGSGDHQSGQRTILDVAEVARPPEDYFRSDLQWVRAYSDLRSDRLAEIYHQTGDIISFFGSQGYLDNGRRKHTLMLLEAVRSLAVHVEALAKFVGRQKRPIDYAMEVQPMIQTPDHSSFPSGHALEAFAIATVLNRLARDEGALDGIQNQRQPFVLAHRIATNRTVAGVHFPVDSLAGAYFGVLLGELVYSMASGGEILTGKICQYLTDTRAEDDSTTGRCDSLVTFDFLLGTFHDDYLEKNLGTPHQGFKDDLLAFCWDQAAEEW